MGGLIQNRPHLSRWHPDYEEAFEAFMYQKHPRLVQTAALLVQAWSIRAAQSKRTGAR